MNHPNNAEFYKQAIALNLAALRHRLRDALMRANAAHEAGSVGDTEIAMGVLMGLEPLLSEAAVMLQASLILYRTACIRLREPPAQREPTHRPLSGSNETALGAVQREIDELSKLNVLTGDRAELLKKRLTAEVIDEHLQAGISVSELVDLYNDLATTEVSAPAQSPDSAAVENALCVEFEQ